MKANWASIGIIVALLVLAVAIFFAGITMSRTVNLNVSNMKGEVNKIRAEAGQAAAKAKREMMAFVYAHRKAALEDRTMAEKDFEEGYAFVDKNLASKR